MSLTFGEQVKIVLKKRNMTIKELADMVQERTGKNMSRQNMTQKLGRNNFQEQDMRLIADILRLPFTLDILGNYVEVTEESAAAKADAVWAAAETVKTPVDMDQADAETEGISSVTEDISAQKTADAKDRAIPKELENIAGDPASTEEKKEPETAATKPEKEAPKQRYITAKASKNPYRSDEPSITEYIKAAAAGYRPERRPKPVKEPVEEPIADVEAEVQGAENDQVVVEAAAAVAKSAEEEHGASVAVDGAAGEGAKTTGSEKSVKEESHETGIDHSMDEARTDAEAGDVSETSDYAEETSAEMPAASETTDAADSTEDADQVKAENGGPAVTAESEAAALSADSPEAPEAEKPEASSKDQIPEEEKQNLLDDLLREMDEIEQENNDRIRSRRQRQEELELKKKQAEEKPEEKKRGWRSYFSFKKNKEERRDVAVVEPSPDGTIFDDDFEEEKPLSHKGMHEVTAPIDDEAVRQAVAEREEQISDGPEKGEEAEDSKAAASEQSADGEVDVEKAWELEVAKQEEADDEDPVNGDINPYTGHEYKTNSVRTHPTRIGYVQVYDRKVHGWQEMTEWAFLGYQERLKYNLGSAYVPPTYLD